MLYETPPVPGLPARFFRRAEPDHPARSPRPSSPRALSRRSSTCSWWCPSASFLGLLLAVAAHRKLKGIAVYRVIFSSTVVSSVAVASVIFGTLLNPVVGFLPWLGINPNPPALESTTWALPAVALISIWQFLGLSFIIMLAGLQTVPDELLEAARIDGAGAWTRFWRMTVPLLSPTIFFAVVVGTIFAFQSFGAVDILITSENAVRLHTNVLIYNIINTLEVDNNPGVAAIMATVLFLLLLGLTMLQMRFLERRVHYAREDATRTRLVGRRSRRAAATAQTAAAHHRQLHHPHRGGRRRALPDLRDDRQFAAYPGPARPAAAPARPDPSAVARLHGGVDHGWDLEVHGHLAAS